MTKMNKKSPQYVIITIINIYVTRASNNKKKKENMFLN